MPVNASIHDVSEVKHSPLPGSENDCLQISGPDGSYVSVFIPPHVSEAVSEVFSRALQAVPQSDGSLKYTTKHSVWFIELDAAMRKVWTFHCDEITGDEDPSWMSGSAADVMDAMNQIDDIEADNCCDDCGALAGGDNLHEVMPETGSFICSDCCEAARARETMLAETSGDDRAHAERDLARGL